MRSEFHLSAWHALCAVALALLSGCYEGDPTDFRQAVVAGRENVTALVIDNELPVMEVGTSLQLAATASTSGGLKDLVNDVSWRSSNPAAVFVDAHGRVTALANGSAQITATLAQFSDTVTVTASNALLQTVTVTGDAAVDECGTGTYTASGRYDDGTDRDITALVDWSVSDATVARMSTLASGRNLLVSLQAGTTGVMATRNGTVSPLFVVTVADNLDAIAITPIVASQIPVGETRQFTATGTRGSVTADISPAALWAVSNTDTSAAQIATVINGDTSPGLLTAASGGTGTLTAACGGQTGSVAIAVVYLNALAIANTRPIELARNATLLLQLEGTYSDASTRPLNESANWSVVTVSGTGVTVSNTAGSRGRVTAGAAEGVSTVTATVDGKTVSVTVSVLR